MPMRFSLFTKVVALVLMVLNAQTVLAQALVATSTLKVSICGDSIVNAGEECDVVGETGAYSTSIAGRQCDTECQFGPYCGDGILQTIFDEECDDGNNADADFCAADCTIEPAATGGGGNTGGGGGGGGGSNDDLGDTQVSIDGVAYPGRTINILLDGDAIGSVRANSTGQFSFAAEASPGATTLGFWATDNAGTRSITFTTTFDITQGAITNVNGVLLPPTLRLGQSTIDPGDPVTVSGQAAPNATIQIFIDNNQFATASSGPDGTWSTTLQTRTLTLAEHTIKARYLRGTGSLRTESSFSSVIPLFVGVEGRPTVNSDLNRDGEVDLIDFSILIFWWQTDGGTSNPPADINTNGRVGIEDFSILLFNWTG